MVSQWRSSVNLHNWNTLEYHWKATGRPLEDHWKHTGISPVAFQCTLGSKFQAYWIATGLPLEDHWLRVRVVYWRIYASLCVDDLPRADGNLTLMNDKMKVSQSSTHTSNHFCGEVHLLCPNHLLVSAVSRMWRLWIGTKYHYRQPAQDHVMLVERPLQRRGDMSLGALLDFCTAIIQRYGEFSN